MTAIPKMLHQTWKTRALPDRWRSLQQSWLDRHPDWQYRCWTDEENRELVRQHYPGLLPAYDGYDEAIKRVDAWRYMVLHHSGGVYADLDCESIRRLDDLVAGHAVVLGQEPASDLATTGVRGPGLDRLLCNAVMASAPGHPFWEHVLRLLVESRHLTSVLEATGPLLLTRAYLTYPDRDGLTIVAPELFYPLDCYQTRDDAATPEQLRSQGAGAYVIHYWDATWRRQQVLNAVRARLRERRRGPDAGGS